jgi:PAS domain S-box-containing protein
MLNAQCLRLLNYSPVAALICGGATADRPIVYCNFAFEDLTGFSRADLMGRGIGYLQNEGASSKTVSPIKDALVNSQDISVMITAHRKAGEPLNSLVHLSHLYDESSAVVGLLGCMFDLAEPSDMSLARGYGELVVELKQLIGQQPKETPSPEHNPEWAFRRIG